MFKYINKIIKQSGNGNENNCYNSATYIVKLLAGESPKSYLSNDLFVNKLHVSNFFKMEFTQRWYRHSFVEKLFSQFPLCEHLIFNMRVIAKYGKQHCFVVEKKNDSKGRIFWRIYQSYEGKCSLNQWLGNVEYKTSGPFDKIIKKYGRGKKLDQTELEEILSILLKSVVSHNDPHVFIQVYEVKKNLKIITRTI